MALGFCNSCYKKHRDSDPKHKERRKLHNRIQYRIKHNIPLDNIETHFCLLKRTAKKNKVEFVKVSSGKKKIENANNLLTKAICSIKDSKHIKNRLSCKGCEFYKTEHCT